MEVRREWESPLPTLLPTPRLKKSSSPTAQGNLHDSAKSSLAAKTCLCDCWKSHGNPNSSLLLLPLSSILGRYR